MSNHLYAMPPGEVAYRLDELQEHRGEPRRSAALIVEIDKAPRNVPNDPLMELEQMRFDILELGRTVAAPRDMRPVLVITSNSEQALPDAFLRRCASCRMRFPGPDRLRQIVAARMEGLDAEGRLLKDAVEIFEGVRKLPLRKKPATAEPIGFVQTLRKAGFGPDDAVRLVNGREGFARVSLLKTCEDQGRGSEALVRARQA